jgi:hypothetical protein
MTNRWYVGTWDPGSDISPEQTTFATANRVPFLTSPHPSRNYLIGIVVDDLVRNSPLPTAKEVIVVAKYAKARLDFWFPKPNRYREEMEAFAPYDIDTAPGVRFMKYANGGWGYRITTWNGPEFLPSWQEPPVTIQAVIERVKKR